MNTTFPSLYTERSVTTYVSIYMGIFILKETDDGSRADEIKTSISSLISPSITHIVPFNKM